MGNGATPQQSLRFLRFHDYLIPWIEAGLKRATTRIGRRRYVPGDQVIYSGTDGIPKGLLAITDVDYCRISDLDDDMAKLENLPSAEALKEKLWELYGDRLTKELITVVKFTFIETIAPRSSS